MKRLFIMFIISLLLVSIVGAQEFDWDEEGTQTLSLFEKFLATFKLGAVVPNQCSSSTHTQKVFDANGNTQYSSVGNACNSGDYMQFF